MDKELPVSAWPEWKIIEKIGEGSFGKVYKAQRTERGKSFYSAIKIINIPGSQSELNSVRSETGDDQAARQYFQNLVEECIQEISTMEYFRGNSYIVSVEDFKVMEYLDAIGWEISIRMEYLTSFMDCCAEKQLTENEVIQLGLDLSKALEYCRKLNIIHRDIKPENIFVSRFGDFKLGDFGIARELERTMSGFSKKGTYSYMAPEMYKGEKYDSGVDIYSLGIVLYKLMNHNRLPFMNLEKQFITYRDKENALTRRMSGEQMEPPAEAGRLFAQIILKACAFDPAKRYQTPEEFYRDLDDLKHGRMTGRAQKTSEIKQKDRPAPTSSGETEPKSRSQAYKTATVQPKQVHPAETVKVSQPVQQSVSQKDREQNIAQSARIMAARRRRRKKEKMLRRALVAAVVGLAVLIAGGLYIRISMHNSSDAPGNSLVDILDNDKYGIDKGDSKDFTTAIENIKDRATTITDDLDSYDWVGSEGTVLRYLKRVKTVENADGNLDIESQCMKALIYPAESGEKKYEEYFYWDEKLFFAYIWYDETAEYYYYDDGELIRWIDANGTCHDNETDNDEYVKRGEKYWNNSLKALKGEGTKTEDGISD
ncbi:serine/threonine-protein kinase [Blautia luti]|uniref:Protein kinase n=1 Tax=Blautia luti DSM 14534 = JCM 17040 TaxID=649762 RepID=A0A844GGU9_9FIRM|nr:serine/threonine-protein kinase [Blautia luti]MTD59858.1 protein kinase [Blautia luti DSM 14534 = JCM 17040]